VKTENGRSMVEILGVLSIMGVLSTVSVWGYSQAINNHKANLILNELNQ
jgi:Tfp pilus assembly protein PilE